MFEPQITLASCVRPCAISWNPFKALRQPTSLLGQDAGATMQGAEGADMRLVAALVVLSVIACSGYAALLLNARPVLAAVCPPNCSR